ncbi:hypothetical protein J6590_053129 [Homalodisca vitripennis]|nr:hypothetical protein J6590_053129 [Homalodisca vitripennis]
MNTLIHSAFRLSFGLKAGAQRDTALFASKSSANHLEWPTTSQINLAQEYCFNNNELFFNEVNATQLILGKLKEKVTGPLNIQALSSTRHVGVILDDLLTWTNHISSLCLKPSEAVFAIKRCSIY